MVGAATKHVGESGSRLVARGLVVAFGAAVSTGTMGPAVFARTGRWPARVVLTARVTGSLRSGGGTWVGRCGWRWAGGLGLQ